MKTRGTTSLTWPLPWILYWIIAHTHNIQSGMNAVVIIFSNRFEVNCVIKLPLKIHTSGADGVLVWLWRYVCIVLWRQVFQIVPDCFVCLWCICMCNSWLGTAHAGWEQVLGGDGWVRMWVQDVVADPGGNKMTVPGASLKLVMKKMATGDNCANSLFLPPPRPAPKEVPLL